MCGIALIRLRKPYQHYIDKYGTAMYGMQKLYLLMEKQRNRGQDGAGVAVIKLDVPAGIRYISRYRSIEKEAIQEIFEKAYRKFRKSTKNFKEKRNDADWLKENVAFTGEVLLGHLRYGTYGINSVENCHPMLRQNNWRSRNLVIAGNFNMTNVEEQFQKLLSLGQHPKEKIDTVTVLEKIGHFLDEENERVYAQFKGQYSKQEITKFIEDNIDLQNVLKRACKDFDGGYAIAGVTGHGAAFVARDPSGIRPAYYYADEEFVVVASEKTAIKAAFNIDYSQIQEIKPAHALIINKDGSFAEKQFIQEKIKKACSFERVYFSRGTDPDIYQERKKLGQFVVPKILKAIDYDLENTVFSYIPNTAETAFLGMIDGLENYLTQQRVKAIEEKNLKGDALAQLLSFRPRVEKLVSKDVKLRTFIAGDAQRDELVASVYDTTYEVVRKKQDTLVVIDDSIVRGTTLEKSILRMLAKLEPKKIIVVSSAPQIRYPDCYGIDMSRIGEFVAFRAVLELLKETGRENWVDDVYQQCLEGIGNGTINEENFVKKLYEPFTEEEISNKIATIVRPKRDFKPEVEVIFQSVEDLHKACPESEGDWYFTGNYPTQGGNKVVNQAFMNFMQGKLERAY
jgi:amidophosphoribosyltransferase